MTPKKSETKKKKAKKLTIKQKPIISSKQKGRKVSNAADKTNSGKIKLLFLFFNFLYIQKTHILIFTVDGILDDDIIQRELLQIFLEGKLSQWVKKKIT